MENESQQETFTLINLLAVMVVGGILTVLFVLHLDSGHTASRRNQCTNQLKQLGLALHNHYDVYKRFPALTNQRNPTGSANIWDTAPGATFAPDSPAPNGYTESPAKAAGYSWIVMILPYMEETVLYNNIAAASDNFQYEAFSSRGAERTFEVGISGTVRHAATLALDEVRCPAYMGEPVSTASSGTARPPVTIDPYAKLFDATARPQAGVAISNYFALSATHLACMALGPDDAATADAEPPNGVIVPGEGLNMKSILDGASKTLILCETKEPAVNSWYDGTVCWTVGANPNASNQPTRNKEGNWIFPPGTKDAGSLNYGPDASGKPLFAPTGTTPAQTQPASWGPSSDHTGGIVVHLAGDASVHSLDPKIDPTLYINLISRAGSEPVTIPDIR